MGSTESIIVWIIGQIVVAAAIWGGIRADLRGLHERVKLAKESADKAHERIDSILHETGSHTPFRGGSRR